MRFAKDGKSLFRHTTVEKKRVVRICAAIGDETGQTKLPREPEKVVETLNQIMVGWANCFCIGPVSKAYRAIEHHARRRVRQWLCQKHQLKWPAIHRFQDRYIDHQLGLIRLSRRTASYSWAKS